MQPERKTIQNVFVIFVIGLAIGNFSTLLFNARLFFNWNNFLERSLYSVILTLFFWQGNQAIIKYINKKNSWLEHTQKVVVKVLISTIIYSLAVMFAFYLYIWIFLMHRKTLEGFYQTFQVGFYVCFSITAIWILVVYANYFFHYWKKALVREEQLKRESLALQYESLKNQVNPHFLFNSLNVLTSLIERDPDASINYVKQLSDVFRYVLDQNVRELVPVESELRFIDSYNFLQKIRFGDNFQIETNIRGKNFLIVPLALQILIENAVKHNEISADNPLTIKIYDDEEFLYVNNNLKPRSNLPDSNQIGLKTLDFQYEFLSRRKVEVNKDNSHFIVKLPKIKTAKHAGTDR